ncbi:unnamed protein product [Timema podura]|uniref:Uncharacterized protein n=1 Tax=Timema podura TaxID=61482 RepID=A0ABN7P3T5_TIMPD|nr:unnamed protein product [Timema podura]
MTNDPHLVYVDVNVVVLCNCPLQYVNKLRSNSMQEERNKLASLFSGLAVRPSVRLSARLLRVTPGAPLQSQRSATTRYTRFHLGASSLQSIVTKRRGTPVRVALRVLPRYSANAPPAKPVCKHNTIALQCSKLTSRDINHFHKSFTKHHQDYIKII